MDKPRTSAAPLIVAVALLLLPVLYVGSYLALVFPGWRTATVTLPDGRQGTRIVRYRAFDEQCRVIFWPVEQVDRQLRPQAWLPV